MRYLFDPKVLHECAQVGIGKPHEEMFDVVTQALAERYPGHIDTGRRNWIFNNAGGAMGQLTLLHASLSEYIIFFGTPIGTEGHSGRYTTDVHDFMMEGEMWCYLEGHTERKVYVPGDHAYLGSNQVKGYRIPESAYMLEYSRGNIPSMLPFGVADTAMSTLDVKTLGRTFYHYGKKTVGSMLKGKF